MRDENDRAVLDKVTLEPFLDNPARGMNVKSSEYVVKKKDLNGGLAPTIEFAENVGASSDR